MTPPAKCGCGQPLLWARTELRNRWMPLDPKPDPAGNQAAWQDGDGILRTRQLADDEKPWDFERVFIPHAATCKGRQASAVPQPATATAASNVIPFNALRARLRARQNRP